MHGNVWEWVQDLDGAYPRKQGATVAESTGNRVVRGGSWANLPGALRSAYRHKHASTHQHYTVGFRVALD
jgi:formylglycine-generating enzyme required for sulfatase activity